MQVPWVPAGWGTDTEEQMSWVHPTFCFYQDLTISCRRPLEHLLSLSLWPRCSLLHPPHPHFPAQEARRGQGRGHSMPHHYHQHRPGSGVPSSLGAWAPGWALALLTSQEHRGHHSAGRGQYHWQVSPGGLDPGHITAHFPTALGRVSQGSRSEH